MKPAAMVLSAVAILFGSATSLQAEDLARGSGESDLAFAKRALRLKADANPHLVSATWNKTPTLFVDYDVREG